MTSARMQVILFRVVGGAEGMTGALPLRTQRYLSAARSHGK